MKKMGQNGSVPRRAAADVVAHFQQANGARGIFALQVRSHPQGRSISRSTARAPLPDEPAQIFSGAGRGIGISIGHRDDGCAHLRNVRVRKTEDDARGENALAPADLPGLGLHKRTLGRLGCTCWRSMFISSGNNAAACTGRSFAAQCADHRKPMPPQAPDRG